MFGGTSGKGSVHPPPGGGLTSLRIHLMGSRETGTCLASSAAVQSGVSFLLTHAIVLTIRDMATRFFGVTTGIDKKLLLEKLIYGFWMFQDRVFNLMRSW